MLDKPISQYHNFFQNTLTAGISYNIYNLSQIIYLVLGFYLYLNGFTYLQDSLFEQRISVNYGKNMLLRSIFRIVVNYLPFSF